MRAATYTRFSSDRQREASTEDQIRKLRASRRRRKVASRRAFQGRGDHDVAGLLG
jgi:DNA invertase Pin-like site-specific DNA recombinase